jgi:hypothetical protein
MLKQNTVPDEQLAKSPLRPVVGRGDCPYTSWHLFGDAKAMSSKGCTGTVGTFRCKPESDFARGGVFGMRSRERVEELQPMIVVDAPEPARD